VLNLFPRTRLCHLPRPAISWTLSNHLISRMRSSGKKGKAVTLAFRSSCINYSNSPSVHRPAIKSSNQSLDSFYRTVLSASPDHEQLHLILAAILVLPGRLEPTPENIEILLKLPPGEVISSLPAVFPLINIDNWRRAISLHISFGDFLLDEKRAGSFHVDIHTQKQIIATQWLEALSTTRLQTYRYESSHSFMYRCLYIHLSSPARLALTNCGATKSRPSA